MILIMIKWTDDDQYVSESFVYTYNTVYTVCINIYKYSVVLYNSTIIDSTCSYYKQISTLMWITFQIAHEIQS